MCLSSSSAVSESLHSSPSNREMNVEFLDFEKGFWQLYLAPRYFSSLPPDSLAEDKLGFKDAADPFSPVVCHYCGI